MVGSPKTKWTVFHDGKPLLHVSKDPNTKPNVNTLAFQTTHQVPPLLGPAPYFAQGHHAVGQTKDHNPILEANGLHGPGIVFLGTHEPNEDALLPSFEFKNPQSLDEISGEPLYALDITSIPMKQLEQTFQVTLFGEQLDNKFEFADPRSTGLAHNPSDAAIFSESRTMVDWNAANKASELLEFKRDQVSNIPHIAARDVGPACSTLRGHSAQVRFSRGLALVPH